MYNRNLKIKFEFNNFVKFLFKNIIFLIKLKLNFNSPFSRSPEKIRIQKFGWYKFCTTLYQLLFPKNLKLRRQKIGFGTGHQDIGQKL